MHRFHLHSSKSRYDNGVALTSNSFIEVQQEGYEIIYKSPPMKTREVVFLANDRAYTISYSTIEDLYDASEEIFDHVLNSFIIK